MNMISAYVAPVQWMRMKDRTVIKCCLYEDMQCRVGSLLTITGHTTGQSNIQDSLGGPQQQCTSTRLEVYISVSHYVDGRQISVRSKTLKKIYLAMSDLWVHIDTLQKFDAHVNKIID
jgi:hypothetical protein